MKSIVYKEANKIEVCELESPTPKEGQVLVKVKYVGICGGDLGIYKGLHPRAKAPLILGHEFSGTVEIESPKFKKGTIVTANPIISCGNCTPCLTGKK